MTHIGIDPGLSGAICCLSEGEVQFYEIGGLVEVMQRYMVGPKSVAIERQGVRPGQAGMGKMMKNYGRLLGIMEAFSVVPTEVQARVWYKHYGIEAGLTVKNRKNKTAQLMLARYPLLESEFYGPRGGLIDGRTDALAIANWLMETCCC